MTGIRLAVALAMLWSGQATSAVFGQNRPSVEVKRLTDDDLQRTAHRLRISVERLRQARQALEAATELSDELEVEHLGAAGPIPGLWVRLRRQEAPDRLEAIIALRSRQVSELQQSEHYRAVTQWVLQVASELAPLHPPRALQAVQSWPAPPLRLGEKASQLFEELQTGLESEEFRYDFSIDPAGAVRSLMGPSSGWSRFYSRLNYLRNSDDREEANRLIDGMLSEIAAQPLGSRSYRQYASLIQQTSSLQHDRTSQLQEALISAVQQGSQNGAEGQTFVFEAEGQKVELKQEEFQFLQTLKQLHQQPETMLMMVDSWPSLREKLDQLGGLDRAMQARPTKYFRSGNAQAQPYPGRNFSEAQKLIAELKFEAFARPWKVHQRLDQMAKMDERFFDQLVQICYLSAAESPELAQMALEHAQPLVEQGEDPRSDLMRLRQFADCYANLEGALSPKLLRQGFSLIERIKTAQQEGSLENQQPMNGRHFSVENVEFFLVGHLARVNFAEALAEARSREDPAERLQLLLAIVQHLVN